MTTQIVLWLAGHTVPVLHERLRAATCDIATRTITAIDEHGSVITVLLGANDTAIITHATPHQET